MGQRDGGMEDEGLGYGGLVDVCVELRACCTVRAIAIGEGGRRYQRRQECVWKGRENFDGSRC